MLQSLISSVEYGKPSCTSVVIIYSENSIIMGPLLGVHFIGGVCRPEDPLILFYRKTINSKEKFVLTAACFL